jgi:sn-glycerol 3-phosphate transport system substrate-binding protein
MGACSSAELSGTPARGSSAPLAPEPTAAPSVGGTAAPSVPGRCAAHDDDPAAPVRVVAWEILGGQEAPRVFDAHVAAFRDAHPGIDLVVESIGGANELLSTLQVTPPQEWPDVVLASPQALRRLVDTGRIVPPAECRAGARLEEGLLPVLRELYRFDGSLQGVPYGVSTPVLFFDRAEVRAAGLDPDDPPSTLAELAAMSQKVVTSGASPHGLVLTRWYAHYLLLSGAVQRGELVVEPDNGRSGGPVTVQFDTRGARESLEWMLDVVATDGGLWIGPVPSGYEDLIRIGDPVDGGTMAVHTSAAIGDVLAVIDGGSFPGAELGIGPMPGPGRGATVGGNGWFLIDHDDPRRVGAAYELVEWMGEPARLAELAAATGYVPPRLSVTAEPVLVAAWTRRPLLRVGFDQLLNQPPTPAAVGPLFGPSSEVDELLFGLTSAVVEGGDSVAEVLARLDAEVGALLAQYDAVVGR